MTEKAEARSGGSSAAPRGAELAFDPADAAFVADPYPRYAELRNDPKPHRTNEGLWVLTRYDQVASVLRDPRWSSDPVHMSAERATQRDTRLPLFGGDGPKVMLLADPPDHTRLRRLANRAFTPRAVQTLRPRIGQIVESLIDDADHGPGTVFDFMAAVAQPLPVLVICELLGVPSADHHQFGPWSSAISRVVDPIPDPALVEAATPAVLGFVAYFNDLIEQRRSSPGEDLLSSLIAAEDGGEHLSVPELFAMVILLFIAGHETTTNVLGNGLLALLRHPDQLQHLREQPNLVVAGVEELLRYDAPVQVTARTATETLSVGDLRIERGEGVMCVLAAANRDPAYVERPDELILERGEPTHFAFGNGIHHCLGAPLARLEAQVALPALISRFPDLALADESPSYRDHFVLRGLASLPISTGALPRRPARGSR
ncbi:MAG: cytochrome P450 [Acidimicrobiales bacterium]